MNIAGIGTARRLIYGKDGTPMPIEDFKRVIDVNLVGTFQRDPTGRGRNGQARTAGRRREFR